MAIDVNGDGVINEDDLNAPITGGNDTAFGAGLDAILDGLGINPSNPDTDLFQSKYRFKSRTFPSDINFDYNGHYMVININVPVTLGGQPRGSTRTKNEYGYNSGGFLANEYSKVDVLRFGNFEGKLDDDVNAAAWSFPRATRRLAESIALFMPSPIIFTDNNDYEEVSLTGMVAGTITATASYASGFFNGPDLGQIIGGIGQGAGTVSGLSGFPINPRVEIVFATTRQRQFVFEVLMAPRNAEESENIKQIVRSLRFHSKPELTGGLGNVAALSVPLYIPPAEFDITFFNKGIENTNIQRINTCVLERIETDYAPAGAYSTFSNGYPVAVRMSLAFREVEPLHKLRVLQGF